MTFVRESKQAYLNGSDDVMDEQLLQPEPQPQSYNGLEPLQVKEFKELIARDPTTWEIFYRRRKACISGERDSLQHIVSRVLPGRGWSNDDRKPLLGCFALAARMYDDKYLSDRMITTAEKYAGCTLLQFTEWVDLPDPPADEDQWDYVAQCIEKMKADADRARGTLEKTDKALELIVKALHELENNS